MVSVCSSRVLTLLLRVTVKEILLIRIVITPVILSCNKQTNKIRAKSVYYTCILYSWKYWRELNSAVEPKIAIARILADLNLAVRYGIAIRIYASRKLWQILIWRL